MSAVCEDGRSSPTLAINPTSLIRGLNIPDYDAYAKKEHARLFARTPTLTLAVFDGKGNKSATLTFGRTMSDGLPNFYRPLSAREARFLTASSRMTLSSAAWTTSFTGKGATKMFAALRC